MGAETILLINNVTSVLEKVIESGKEMFIDINREAQYGRTERKRIEEDAKTNRYLIQKQSEALQRCVTEWGETSRLSIQTNFEMKTHVLKLLDHMLQERDEIDDNITKICYALIQTLHQPNYDLQILNKQQELYMKLIDARNELEKLP